MADSGPAQTGARIAVQALSQLQKATNHRPGFNAAAWASRVHGRNINEQSLLATDYLNHFNEIIMLIELLPDMPECLEEAQQWQPKSYVEHFQDSCFADKELAIEAYEHAPPRFKKPFERTVAHMDRLIEQGLEDLEAVVGEGNNELTQQVASVICGRLRALVDIASGIIHGNEETLDQTAIDGLITP